MIFRSTLLLAVGLAVVAGILGCGGDSGDASGASSSAPSISQAEFVKQANAACDKERGDLNEQIADFERSRNGERPRAYADMVHFVFLPTIEAQVFYLEKLDVPRGGEERVEAILDAERTAIDSVAVKPRVPSLTTAERHFSKPDKLLLAYGLSSCVNDIHLQEGKGEQ